MKIAIVSSCGGHLTEVRSLAAAYDRHPHFYVIDDLVDLPPQMQHRTYFVTHSERDWRLILNFAEAFRILMKERPDVILSTGAGVVVPFAVIGRLFFRTNIIYIETMTRVIRPSLCGRIMYYLAHKFFYQWEPLRSHFPKGIYAGTLI